MGPDASQFIISQLVAKGIDYIADSEDIMIKCPFHQHSGTKYKLNIKRDGTAVHCWVCDWSGNYNKLARTLGLNKLDLTPQFGYLKTKLELTEELDEDPTPKLPYNVEPLDIKWHRFGNGPDLPRKFLQQFDSHKWFDRYADAYRIIFEVKVPDLIGWFGVRTDQITIPKQRNMPGNWIKKKALFPLTYPLVSRSKSVVLVEGPFDALRLIYAGIPALAIFGTTNWSKMKRNMILTKFSKIVLAFDGDDPGRLCTSEVYDSLETMTTVKVVEMPDGVDPGCADDAVLEEIRKLL